jgi:uncharacterized membrane protein
VGGSGDFCGVFAQCTLRTHRWFNSWDLLTNPAGVVSFLAHNLAQPWAWAVMFLTFVAIAAIYWPLKHISLALMFYWQQSPRKRQLSQPFDDF